MSISSRIEAIEQHITDDYSVLELAGADLTNVDKNIQNLKQAWEERLLYFLANGTDVIWNNWLPKVTGTGENITLNSTVETKMKFVCKGNTSQNGEPTPDNPVNIDVVTGNNSIIIANNDNTQSQTYPINLGSMELCKIGDYQDYLYKDNGKWYKYGAIGKLTITSISDVGTASTGIKYALVRGVSSASASSFIYCSNYVNATSAANNNSIRFSGTNLYVYDNRLTDYTTALNLLNGLEYYCVLATPTSTEITDTTLIEQLDNLEKAYSYNTQTNISQTNADKPFILDVVALGELA